MQKDIMSCWVSEPLISDVLQLTLDTHLFANILASEYWELYRDASKEYMLAGVSIFYVSTYLVKCLDTIKPDWFGFLFYLRIYWTLIIITSGIFINKIPTILRNLSLFIGSSTLEITAVHFCMSLLKLAQHFWLQDTWNKKKTKQNTIDERRRETAKKLLSVSFFLLIYTQKLNYPERNL